MCVKRPDLLSGLSLFYTVGLLRQRGGSVAMRRQCRLFLCWFPVRLARRFHRRRASLWAAGPILSGLPGRAGLWLCWGMKGSLCLGGLGVLLAVAASSPVRGADAFTTTNSRTAFGYVNGSVGFAFTPATNLAVTRVGFLNKDMPRPVVHFWSDTNFIFASYPVDTSNAPLGQMVWTNISLTLLAGNRYAVQLLADNAPVLLDYYLAGDFTVAPQLTNFSTRLVFPTNIQEYGTQVVVLGPNFSFTNTAAGVSSPRMSYAPTNGTNLVLAWPASPAGFVLQRKASLSVSNWTLVTNVTRLASGTNQHRAVSAAGNGFYRLVHP